MALAPCAHTRARTHGRLRCGVTLSLCFRSWSATGGAFGLAPCAMLMAAAFSLLQVFN